MWLRDEYPLQPKKHSLEFLREKAHLRFRTNTFGAGAINFKSIIKYLSNNLERPLLAQT